MGFALNVSLVIIVDLCRRQMGGDLSPKNYEALIYPDTGVGIHVEPVRLQDSLFTWNHLSTYYTVDRFKLGLLF